MKCLKFNARWGTRSISPLYLNETVINDECRVASSSAEPFWIGVVWLIAEVALSGSWVLGSVSGTSPRVDRVRVNDTGGYRESMLKTLGNPMCLTFNSCSLLHEILA